MTWLFIVKKVRSEASSYLSGEGGGGGGYVRASFQRDVILLDIP